MVQGPVEEAPRDRGPRVVQEHDDEREHDVLGPEVPRLVEPQVVQERQLRHVKEHVEVLGAPQRPTGHRLGTRRQ